MERTSVKVKVDKPSLVPAEGESSSNPGLSDNQAGGDFCGDSKDSSLGHANQMHVPTLPSDMPSFSARSDHSEKHCSADHHRSHNDSAGAIR